MTAVVFEVIQDEARLHGIVPEWWALWDRCRDAPPFLAPSWLLPWWRHFAPGRLFVPIASRDGTLVGLAPSYIEEAPLGRRVLPLGISLSDSLDVLADPDCEQDALSAIADATASRSGDWDSWEMENLPPSAAALRLRLPPGFDDAIQEQDPCPCVSVPACAATLADFVPRAKRSHVNLARNRAARRGEVSVESSDAAGIGAALEHLFRLHGARWESQGGPGVLAAETVRRFHQEAAPAMHAAGLLMLDLLWIGSEVAAAQYTLRRCDRLSIYLTGFDPAFAFESPGVILMASIFERALMEDCREIDFLRGREPYKYEWGASDRSGFKRIVRRR